MIKESTTPQAPMTFSATDASPRSSLANTPLRIGVLGTSRVASYALFDPARNRSDVMIVGVGGRDPLRTSVYAKKHRIPYSFESYDAVLADPNIDAIYVPLPPSLHCEWSIKALEAGKHVLCEKPMACTPDEAVTMRDAARASDRVLMEAFHYRYHPLLQRVREHLESGHLGEVRHVEACIKVNVSNLEDIRFNPELSGGALLDAGCYTVNMVRFVKGDEPIVQSAQAKRLPSGVDTETQADLTFADGSTGNIRCSLRAKPWQWRLSLRVEGTRGSLLVINPLAPHFFNWLSVREGNRTVWRGSVHGSSTYAGQLNAFVGAINKQEPFSTTADDAIKNLKVLHQIQQLSA